MPRNLATSSLSCLLLLCWLLHAQADEGVKGAEGDYVTTITLVATHAGKDGAEVKKDILIGVRRGEDAAAAAARACYENGILPTDQVLNVLSYIKNALEGKEHQPEVELLRTAGAYMKRAAELSANDQYIEAAADLVRAIDRNGLDPTVRSKISQLLQDAFKDQKAFDEQLEKERKIADELEKREKAEREAEEESARRKAMDETDWSNFKEELLKLLNSSGSRGEEEEEEVLASVSFHLEGKGSDGNKVSEDIAVSLQASQDVSEVAFQFCSSKGLHSHAEVLKVKRELISQASKKGYKSRTDLDVEALKDAAKRLEKGGSFLQAGTAYSKIVHAMEGSGDEGQVYKTSLERMLQVHQKVHLAYSSFIDGKYEDALKLVDEILPFGQNSTMLLVKAKSHQLLGQWADVTRTAGQLLQEAELRGAWKRGQHRMMAVTLGSHAALELGDGERALKFYQAVLRNDPDQQEISKQYKSLKQLLKLLKESDEKIQKSQNHKALDVLSHSLSVMKGMDATLCRVYAELKRYEEALLACDQCVQRRSMPVAGLFVDPAKLAEALKLRAQAHVQDHNYDEAVRDYRKVQELTPGRDDVSDKLNEALRMQNMWKTNRDHKLVLELPVNLHMLPVEKQCVWIKKQHKLLARKWHPDKAKGDKNRATRKMHEVSEAKEALSQSLGC
ncbi:hypothetical protein GUITHDRAFT_136477 [Guillardia theta CCMP2712]|uniref:J domain-containing protein n=1 Tax=Guillardia theta (strain CCMP2712) TaxID=905079 RepID=L1JK12_GUITC|nr:hypothetical protein GUITHDRAFT_136477 [Guillardia theta CCMP2712]EKX48811.1 hypothetical protein GUITHDRAFT_136477 [Guillardia theta CCMP2712]|eukprot:XP_005835791.1 hypothetical protein GUITHDRAFT_136477 [Guillardia theta CCMP2712]